MCMRLACYRNSSSWALTEPSDLNLTTSVVLIQRMATVPSASFERPSSI